MNTNERDTAQERLRILRAARDGRMKVNQAGRYVIDYEQRPDRKVREALMQQGFITWPSYLDREQKVRYLGADAEIASLEALLG